LPRRWPKDFWTLILYRLTVAKLRQESLAAEVDAGARTASTEILPSQIASAQTVLDLHASLNIEDQRALAELLFDGIWIDHTGVRRYDLRRTEDDSRLAA
jgi:hypothetical protein